ncbi:MAG: PA3496 family putative envelope integrity protein [Woeseiaceae bacterium]
MQKEAGDPEIVGDDEEVTEDDDVELDEEVDAEDTVVFSTSKGSDNIGDVSVEINVEELIAEFESNGNSDAARKKEIRRRLEEIREQREVMKDLEDTYSFDPNEDD